jgi:hypothetical protein
LYVTRWKKFLPEKISEKNTRKVVRIPLVGILFSGYICNNTKIKRQRRNELAYKIATNQSLNQKSRCFYIGAFFLLAKVKNADEVIHCRFCRCR